MGFSFGAINMDMGDGNVDIAGQSDWLNQSLSTHSNDTDNGSMAVNEIGNIGATLDIKDEVPISGTYGSEDSDTGGNKRLESITE